MQHINQVTEVLTFRRGDNIATVVTNGVRHKTYAFEEYNVYARHKTREWVEIDEHARLSQAIAHLESKGYSIDMEAFNGK